MHAPDEPDRRARMILAWARKRRAGTFSEDDEPSLAARVVWGEIPTSEYHAVTGCACAAEEVGERWMP